MKIILDKLREKEYTEFRKLNKEVIICLSSCLIIVNSEDELGCSDNTLSAKLNHLSEFDQSEIVKSINILDLSVKDIPTYFFTKAV